MRFYLGAPARQDYGMQISLLLVDDEEADIIRFKRAARKAGVERCVEVCRSGSEAYSLLAAKADRLALKPEYFLVSDLKMPLMRGTELVTRIRRDLGLTALPAFILSSSKFSPGHRRGPVERGQRLHREM